MIKNEIIGRLLLTGQITNEEAITLLSCNCGGTLARQINDIDFNGYSPIIPGSPCTPYLGNPIPANSPLNNTGTCI